MQKGEKKDKGDKGEKGKDDKSKKSSKKNAKNVEPEPEPEVKVEEEDPKLAKRFKYKQDIALEQVKDFYEKTTNVIEAAKFLAEILGFQEYTVNARQAIFLDYCLGILMFAKEAGFSLDQCLLLYKIGLELMYILTGGGVFAEAEKFFKERFFLSVKEYGKDIMLPFSNVDMKKITRFFTTTFFQHYSLYRYSFLKEPVVITKEQRVTVQTAKTLPLFDAFTTEELELIQLREEAIKAAAELEKKHAEEAAAKGAADALVAAQAAAQLLENQRKPQSLEEAIEFAVREKVAESKRILDEEYNEREAALITKFNSIDATTTRSSIAKGPTFPSQKSDTPTSSKTAASSPSKTPISPKSPTSPKTPTSPKSPGPTKK